MLVGGMNTFNLCLNKEIGVCALPYRFKTLVCFYQRTERRKRGIGDGHLYFLFQRPVVSAFLEVKGDKEERETR